MKAISIRQPWVWAILNAGKDIENRDWPTRYRGRVLLHASKGMTNDEYEDCVDTIVTIRRNDLTVTSYLHIPPAKELLRGGICGEAEIVDCVENSESPWFFGRYGFVLRNVKPLPFMPCNGALGFFPAPIQTPEDEK